MGDTMTIGDQIAAEFSRDKHHLSDAEQRRLAGMIDAAIPKPRKVLAYMSGGDWADASVDFMSIPADMDAGKLFEEYQRRGGYHGNGLKHFPAWLKERGASYVTDEPLEEVWNT